MVGDDEGLGKGALVYEEVCALREAPNRLRRLGVPGVDDRPVARLDPIPEGRETVDRLARSDLQAFERELVAGTDDGERDFQILQVRVKAPDRLKPRLRPLGAEDHHFVLAEEPPGLRQGEEVGDVVEMEVGDEGDVNLQGREARLRQPQKGSGAAVEEDGLVGLHHQPRLSPARVGDADPGPKKGHLEFHEKLVGSRE